MVKIWVAATGIAAVVVGALTGYYREVVGGVLFSLLAMQIVRYFRLKDEP